MSHAPDGPPGSEALASFATASTMVAEPQSAENAPPAAAPATTGTGLHRKIVYSAHVDLVVENLDDAQARVVTLVKRVGAYVADSNTAGTTGETRRATWKIRVPVARFEEFVDAAKDLGELKCASTESQDVSEDYYDVDARIRNKTREEERLLKLLEDRPGKLDDVMAIERALSKTREELERMQGRLRVLTDLTAMTTVQLSITEIHGYTPPQNPAFEARVRRAFHSSLGSLRTAGEDTCVTAALVAPWAGMMALVIVPCFSLARTMHRRRARQEPRAVDMPTLR